MGKHPFSAQNEGALIRKILKGNYPPPTGHCTGLQELVNLSLTYDPSKRPDAQGLLAMPIVWPPTAPAETTVDVGMTDSWGETLEENGRAPQEPSHQLNVQACIPAPESYGGQEGKHMFSLEKEARALSLRTNAFLSCI
jgi:hypothetical protein